MYTVFLRLVAGLCVSLGATFLRELHTYISPYEWDVACDPQYFRVSWARIWKARRIAGAAYRRWQGNS